MTSMKNNNCFVLFGGPPFPLIILPLVRKNKGLIQVEVVARQCLLASFFLLVSCSTCAAIAGRNVKSHIAPLIDNASSQSCLDSLMLCWKHTWGTPVKNHQAGHILQGGQLLELSNFLDHLFNLPEICLGILKDMELNELGHEFLCQFLCSSQPLLAVLQHLKVNCCLPVLRSGQMHPPNIQVMSQCCHHQVKLLSFKLPCGNGGVFAQLLKILLAFLDVIGSNFLDGANISKTEGLRLLRQGSLQFNFQWHITLQESFYQISASCFGDRVLFTKRIQWPHQELTHVQCLLQGTLPIFTTGPRQLASMLRVNVTQHQIEAWLWDCQPLLPLFWTASGCATWQQPFLRERIIMKSCASTELAQVGQQDWHRRRWQAKQL